VRRLRDDAVVDKGLGRFRGEAAGCDVALAVEQPHGEPPFIRGNLKPIAWRRRARHAKIAIERHKVVPALDLPSGWKEGPQQSVGATQLQGDKGRLKGLAQMLQARGDVREDIARHFCGKADIDPPAAMVGDGCGEAPGDGATGEPGSEKAGVHGFGR